MTAAFRLSETMRPAVAGRAARTHQDHSSQSGPSGRGSDWTSSVSENNTEILEPRSFRAFFAVRFSQFLRTNYRNHEEVAASFGVRSSTAWNWWEGNHRASGDVVAMAFMRHPDAMRKAMEADQ